MSRIRFLLIGTGVIAATGVTAWKFLLTDEARDSIASTAENVYDTFANVKDALDDRHGTYVNDVEANRKNVRRQWEKLGIF